MKNKIYILVLAMFIILSIAPVYNANAAEQANIDVEFSASSTYVEKGETFRFTVKITNNHTVPITDVSVAIDDDCGYNTIGSGYTKTLDNDIGTNDTDNVDFQLAYEKGSESIPVQIKYKLEGSSEYIKYDIKYTGMDIDEDDDSPSPSTPVDSSKYMPVLSIMNGSLPAGWAGSTVTIPLNIKNTSSYLAKDITITPEFEGDSPFVIDSINLSQHIDEISDNKSKTVNLKFTISPDAQNKVYPIKLNIKYYNNHGDFFSNSQISGAPEYIYVKVLNSSSAPKLSISNTELSIPSVQPGQNVDVRLNIANRGTMEARDVKVSLIGLKEDGFSLYGDTNVKTMDALGGGQSTSVSFTVTPSNKMESGSYGLTAKIDYKDQSETEYSMEQQFFIPVDNSSSIKTVPKIILSMYRSEPTIVKAGQNFKLSLVFLNTSSEKAVKNIKIYFTVPEGGTTEGGSGSVFTPVNSSNTFFIDYIEPKGTYEKELQFFTIPDASPKTYTMTANFEYEDDKGTEYKASDIIGIPVSQQISLETTDIDMPEEVYAGQPIPVGLDLYNTGKVQLRNMMVRLEGSFNIQNGRYFIGNFDAGSSDHFEGTIIPNAPGPAAGAIILSYDEPTGEHREIRKDFTVNVGEMPVPPAEMGMPREMGPGSKNQGGIFKKPVFWICLGMAGAAVAGFIVFRKIRKRKKEGMMIDE